MHVLPLLCALLGSAHFKPLGILKSHTRQRLAGRPRGRATSTVRAARPCKGEKDETSYNLVRATEERNILNLQERINKHITSQPEPKRGDMRELHRLILQVSPACKLWFFDGKDSKNHTVSNPTIGYGFHTIKYANGKSREFFQIGVSGNKTGISVYILGLKDKKYLAKTYGKNLGKASVTGYCIRFKALNDINIDTLEAAIRYGLAPQNGKGKLTK